VEEDADEFAEVDGIDLLMVGVEAEEKSGGGVLERVGGVVGVGEVVAGERDDELGVAVGENALVAVRGSGSQAYQKDLMKGARAG
jgi:hypothetical protein